MPPAPGSTSRQSPACNCAEGNRSDFSDQAGNYAEAVKLLEAAVAANPQDARELSDLCFARIRLKQWPEAVQAGEAALRYVFDGKRLVVSGYNESLVHQLVWPGNLDLALTMILQQGSDPGLITDKVVAVRFLEAFSGQDAQVTMRAGKSPTRSSPAPSPSNREPGWGRAPST